MFLALQWVVTIGVLVSRHQQQDAGDNTPLSELLRRVADIQQNVDKQKSSTLSPDPPQYSCLKDTPLQIDVPEGTWEGTTKYHFNGNTYTLIKDGLWTPDDILIDDDTWRKQINFMLIGCAKCGSTSTCEFLMEHPSISRPLNKETQCFFENWDEDDPYCKNWYNVNFLYVRQPEIVSGDMTPEYLFRTEDVIPRMQNAFPWTKLIAIFRDPIERGYSEYRMKVANGKTRKSFEERIAMDLTSLRKAGLLPYWRFASTVMEDGNGIINFDDWKEATFNLDVFNTFHGSQEEIEAWVRYQSDVGNGVLGRGLYRIQLSRWMMAFPCERFLILRMEDYDEENGVEITMQRLHHHLGLEYVPLESQEARNTRHTESDILPDTRTFLETFFKPYNDRLYEILGDEWKQPWVYGN